MYIFIGPLFIAYEFKANPEEPRLPGSMKKKRKAKRYLVDLLKLNITKHMSVVATETTISAVTYKRRAARGGMCPGKPLK